MVVYLRRDGAHAQESVYLDDQTHLSPGVHVVRPHLVAHPDSAATLGELARLAGEALGSGIGPRRTRRVAEDCDEFLRVPPCPPW